MINLNDPKLWKNIDWDEPAQPALLKKTDRDVNTGRANRLKAQNPQYLENLHRALSTEEYKKNASEGKKRFWSGDTTEHRQNIAKSSFDAKISFASKEQAAEIFDAVEVSDLSEAEAEQLVEAVQDAPEEVRAEFEDSINVFDNKFNKYVPIGSNINVGQRKVLVAASGVLFMAPTVSVSSSSSGPQSDSRKRK